MTGPFFEDNFNFSAYNTEHGIAVAISIVLGTLFIYFANTHLNHHQKKVFGTIIAIIVLLSQLMKVYIKMELGTFDKTIDLPLHLCNMMPFLVPFAMLFANRQIWAILFFWIMSGTFQSLISPTLEHSFPHFEFWRYWVVHCGLVFLMLYGVFCMGFRLTFKDALWSALLINVLALLMYFVNLGLDSNYLYLMAKPPGTTLYTFLGPWPWYILSLEGVLVILFSLCYLPFHLVRQRA